MIKADFHVHTNFSSDSCATMDSQIQSAIEHGLQFVCITDHNDVGYKSRTGDPEYQIDLDSYVESVNVCKEKYKNKIKVLLGIELGLVKQRKYEIIDSIERHKFDFIIGSSHVVNGSDPTVKGYFEGISEKEGYLNYFNSILDNVRLFDIYSVYGHLDYVVRYGPNKNRDFNLQDYEEVFREIFKIIVEKNKGIEINTSGLYRNLGHFHPAPAILKLYKEMGGKIITFGSDSHKNDTIAYNFLEARDIVNSLGFQYYAVFENMIPTFYVI